MKNPDQVQIQAVAQVAVHNPRFVEWVREWQQMELQRLPVVIQNTAVAQGRCQVLNEIVKLLDEAPAVVANSR